jgi:hypothetical protein
MLTLLHPSDLYDADQRTRDAHVQRVSAKYRIPHPLPKVQYADGIAPWNAGREVRSPWIEDDDVQTR